MEKLDFNEIVFPRLGIDLHIDSTAFSIGGLTIQWYGILITIGLVLAILYAMGQAKAYGLNPDRALDAVIGGIIGGVIGARAYYVIFNWSLYKDDWLSIFSFREGGLAIYGGIIGAVLAGCLVAKLRRVKILPLLDLAAMGFLLGQGIGRWGNFFNQEAFGANTDSLFGMSGGRIARWISQEYPYTEFYMNFGKTLDPTQPVHPCFLYESVWCLLGFLLCVLFAKKIRRFDGQIFLMYIGWYGLERAIIEGLRVDSLVVGHVRISQMLAVLCVIASVILLTVGLLRVKRLGSEHLLYVQTEESRALIAEYERAKQAEKDSPEAAEAADTADGTDSADGTEPEEADEDSGDIIIEDDVPQA